MRHETTGSARLGRARWWLAGVAALAWGCNEDTGVLLDGGIPGGGAGGSVRTIDSPATALFGTVTDAAGEALVGVTVTVAGATATTGADGRYEIKVEPAARVGVRFTREGYLSTTRTASFFDREATAVDAALVTESAARPLDAAAGGALEGPRGARLTAPAGAFVGADGRSVAGEVLVHITPLDPSDEREVNGASGDFLGAAAGGDVRLLESFGMVDITVRQGDETLQVAPGASLDVEIPAPAGVADPPETVPLWSFDEAEDRWVEEGTATYDPATRTYRASVAHLSKWNADQRVDATCITGLVNREDGEPLAGALVAARGLDYSGTSTTHTLEDGRFYVAVRKNSRLSVLAAHQHGGGQIREVESGAADTDIPPQPGDPRCLDVGEWRVVEGEVTLRDGRTIDCADLDNPIAQSCAAEFWGVLDCYRPFGACDTTYTEEGTTTRYANGSSFDYRFDQQGMTFSGSGRGPAGQLCFTADGTFDPGSPMFTVDYTLANGRTYRFTMNMDTDAVTIRCPNGESVAFTPEAQENFQACGGMNEQENDQQCTVNGQSVDEDPDAGVAGGGQLCQVAGDCPGGTICCIPPVENIPERRGICYPPDACAQLIAAMERNGGG